MERHAEPLAPPMVPYVLPWRHVIVLTCAALLVALPGLILAEHAGAVAAIAGLMTAGYATSSTGLRGAIGGGTGLLGALALLLIWPSLPSFGVICALLCIAAGIELARQGSRISVMILLALTMTTVSLHQSPEPKMLAFVLIGLVAGHATIGHLGLSSIVSASPEPKEHAIRLGVFLGFGLAISLICVAVIPEHRSYWVAILFVSRALIPFPDSKQPLLRYGKGAAVGILAAVLIEVIAPPETVRLLIALAALVLGIRFLPNQGPIGATMMTVAVLLGTAPTFGEAAFRAEAIFLVITIMVLVGVVLDSLWSKVCRS